jgi:hypothetical protein
MHLARASAEVSVLSKELRQHHGIGHRIARLPVEHIDAACLRPPSAQKRSAAGIAERILAVGAVKPHAARGEPVNIGRLHLAVSVATQMRIHVVHHYEQDVGMPRWCISGARISEKSQRQGGDDDDGVLHRGERISDFITEMVNLRREAVLWEEKAMSEPLRDLHSGD